MSGAFSLLDDQGRTLYDSIRSDLRWRVRLESYEPAQYVFSLQVGVKGRLEEAERFLKNVDSYDFSPRIQCVGGIVRLDGRVLARSVQYRILMGEFNSEEDALAYGWKFIDTLNCAVVREKIREPRGMMEVFDAEYDRAARIENGIRLVPATGRGEMVLYDVQADDGTSFHRTCGLPLYFRVGERGDIIGINEIPLET